jgi:hypothetical protein
MSTAKRLSRRLVGMEGNSLSALLRENRWRRLLTTFPDLPSMRVIDIGGTEAFWRRHEEHPAHVTLVNLRQQDSATPAWLHSIVADACNLPPDLGEFDLALSNSVIEHVGGHWRRQRFAEGIRSIAPRYWVQTPYRYFPIEPHFVFPFFQHLPRAAQARIAVAWPLGNYGGLDDLDAAIGHVQNIELLGRAEMGWYFSDAEILTERALGLPKALIAIKR